ncbi:MAG: histidine kinase [Tannerella sp.]|jgi:signal transduction histidine kinase|nr:histidine kinase [Tannerella sp.]
MSVLAFVMFGCDELHSVTLNVVRADIYMLAYVVGIVGVLSAFLLWVAFRRKIRNGRKEQQFIASQAMLEGKKEERKRLARDLHDGLGGMLSAVKIALVTDDVNLPFLREKINCCIEELARVAHHLMPASLSHFGLKAALKDYCLSFSNVEFHFFGEDRRFDERVEFEVYCCACELVNNSFKHSGATNIDVQLMLTNDRVMLTVYDDGCGFDKTLASKGAGLKNIKDRIAVFNGKIDINTSPGNGTETNIELKTEI